MGENEESYSEIHTITNERQLFDAQFNSVEQIGEGQGNLYLLDKALNFSVLGMQFIGVIIAEGFDGRQNCQYAPFKPTSWPARPSGGISKWCKLQIYRTF